MELVYWAIWTKNSFSVFIVWVSDTHIKILTDQEIIIIHFFALFYIIVVFLYDYTYIFY